MILSSEKLIVPPIKSQGIKTKLIPEIRKFVKRSEREYKRWVEPFMGTGAVGFNCLAPDVDFPEWRPGVGKHLMCDVNPHIIDFYNAIKSNDIDENVVREYLERQSVLLQDGADEFYKEVRNRFNKNHSSLDFLFLTRACFNGMMRFNSKGEFNVPFCKKPERFSKAYITKICNQVETVRKIIKYGDYEFRCQDFTETLTEVNAEEDFVYCDPPYSGRHTEYYNDWSIGNDIALAKLLYKYESDFIVSTWVENKYSKNELIEKCYTGYPVYEIEHFYHVGASENNRHPMIEGLIFYFKYFKKYKVFEHAYQLGEFNTLKEAEKFINEYSEKYNKHYLDILSPL